jgi:D-3-phosphoglycerate dehydrogenase
MNKRVKVLIVDHMHPSIVPLLHEAGCEVAYCPDYDRSDILAQIPAFQGLVIRSKTKVDRELIDAATGLQFIGRSGAGLDGIDVDYAIQKGIEVLHAAEGNRDAVAEHTVGMLLALMNHLKQAQQQIALLKWQREENRGYELKGKTFAIIGFGYMGSAVAERLLNWGCRLLAYDKYKQINMPGVEQVSLETVFAEADIVSFHVPLTAETKAWVNARFWAAFRKPVWTVNTARGEILKLGDLTQAIKSGKVLGAALDVLENERFETLTNDQKLVINELSGLKNVIFSPHVAGWTFESYLKLNEVLTSKVKKILRED